MSVDVYIGKNSYAYWKEESTFNNAEAMGNGSSQKHIPFNKMKGLVPPKPKYVEKSIITFDSEVPSIKFTELLKTGEGDIEGIFKDPFNLLEIFTTRTMSNPWTGTSDTITGSFTGVADKKTIAMHYFINARDGGNDIERTLKGGHITKYQWVIRKGDVLKEVIGLKFASFADAQQAPDIDDGFDGGEFNRTGVDGGFGGWDGEETRPIHAKTMSLKWGGSVLAGLSIENFTLTINVNKMFEHIQSSQVASIEYNDVKSWEVVVDGFLKTKAHVEEVEKLFSSKTRSNTLKISYNTGEDKYIQFTNAVFSDDFDIIPIPEAGQAAKCRFVIREGESSALSMSWTGDEATDPSGIMAHDN